MEDELMISRRGFLETGLRSLPLLSLAPTVPGFLARTARAIETSKDDRVLVVIQLDGGNDGINTVVPYLDEGYAKHRKELRLPADRVLKIADGIGLNPLMGDAAKLLESGRLTIVQGVGYPNPSRSHFASMATWHTARLDPEEHTGTGWIGRGLDLQADQSALYVGEGDFPADLRNRRSNAASLANLDDLRIAPDVATRIVAPGTGDDLAAFARRSALDAYATADRLAAIAHAKDAAVRYPDTDLGRRLLLVSRLLKGNFGARVFYVNQSGYDTHSMQLFHHADLLRGLFGGVKAFLDDLAASKLADRVLVLAFSEFGRRVAENGSAGTDHGTAGPVFLAGSSIKPGLVGNMPSLADLDDGDLKTSIDFRRIYATLLDRWLGLSARETLGGEFEPLSLV
jgi:uncharacterized protein (DUF1501 family)